MADEKVFPKPRSPGNYREPSAPSNPATPIATQTQPTLVTRAEPPPEDEENSTAEKPKLSQDELKAFLAVDKSANLGRFSKTRARFAVASFPALFGSIIADKLFGWWGIPVTLACTALWALWPMRKQDREGW